MSETADQARTRRRWITLAEFVAVAGLVIAALTLWNSWSDRRADQQAKQQADAGAAREETRVELKATVADGGRRLTLADLRHDIQDVTVTFPRALGVAVQRPSGDPVIEADWFADALLAATDGGADERTGRVPALVEVRYWAGDEAKVARNVYDIVWRTEPRVLRGRTLRLDGLRLRARGGDQAAVDAAWVREKPKG